MFNATWPFADLKADEEKIVLKVAFSGTYTFPAAQVVAVRKYVLIPFLGWGIRIHHEVSGCPEKVIFWYLGLPSTVLSFLRSARFPAEKIGPIQSVTGNDIAAPRRV